MPIRPAHGLLVAGLAGAAAALAQPAEMSMPSCVKDSPPLRSSAAAPRAALDGADRRRFQAAAEAKYPLYQRGGFVPPMVLMMQRGGQWQYVTLWQEGSTGLCVTAVFAADRFDFTPALLAKYRPQPGDAAD